MKALVIGGGGFIGRPLVRRLMADGCQVAVLGRTGAGASGGEGIVGDRADAAALARLVEAHGFETVVDLIGFTVADTAPVLEALSGRIRRYVFVSSSDVYRNYGGLHRRETPEPITSPLDEDAPVRTSRFPYRQHPPRAADDPERWLDDYDKIPIEAAVRAQSGFEHAILRLPMVYGPRDKQRRFAWLIRPMAEGRPQLLIGRAWAEWRTTYGLVEDVAAGIALAATHPAAANRTFNLGGEPVPHTTWAARFAEALGWRGEVRLVDQGVGPMSRALAGLDLHYPLALDTARIRGELGYGEPTSAEAALAATVEDELARPRSDHLDRQYAAEDAALAGPETVEGAR